LGELAISGATACVAFSLPFHLKALTNARGHWAVRAKPIAEHRKAVALYWATLSLESRAAVAAWMANGGIRVVLTRVAPRELDDDNLRSSFKGIRDEVAKRIGVDDRSKLLKWEYDWVKPAEPRTYAAIVTLYPRVEQ
jgi:hypothetical protein